MGDEKNVILVIGIFLTSSADLCFADEKKGHICFRALDSDRDGVVTLAEFEQYYKNDKENGVASYWDEHGYKSTRIWKNGVMVNRNIPVLVK